MNAVVAAAIVLSFAQPAHAYLDPGTGSIIVQGIVAGVAATVAYAGMYWQRVKAFFTGRSGRSETDTPDAAGKHGDPSP